MCDISLCMCHHLPQPFVQGYWGLAAAKHHHVTVFADELNNLGWLSRRKQSFAEFYELNGTFPEKRRRQLWSDTGFLCLILQGLFGLTFLTHGVEFHPVKPAFPFDKTISLRGVRYRNMTLDIHVTGSGSNIGSIKVNELQLHRPYVPSTLKGRHTISITLGNDVVPENMRNESTAEVKLNALMLFTLFGALLVGVGIRSRFTTCSLCQNIISGSDSERLTQ